MKAELLQRILQNDDAGSTPLSGEIPGPIKSVSAALPDLVNPFRLHSILPSCGMIQLSMEWEVKLRNAPGRASQLLTWRRHCDSSTDLPALDTAQELAL